MIASLAMGLRYSFEMIAEADALEAAIAETLDAGIRTSDIMAPGAKEVNTSGMGDAVAERLRAKLS